MRVTKARLVFICILIALVYYAVLYSSFLYLVRFFLELLPEENYDLIALLQPSIYLLMAAIVYFIARKVFNFSFEYGRINFRLVLFFVLISFLFRIAIDFIINFDFILGYKELSLESSLKDIMSIKFWVSLMSSLVFIPILEEVVFRGLIFKLLMTKWNFFTSAIISSALFSIGHINPLSLHFSLPIASFLFGFLMAIFYLKYRLKGVILIHALYNTLVLLLSLNQSYYFEFLKIINFDWRYWCIIILAVLGLILMLFYYSPRFRRKGPLAQGLQKNKKSRS